MMINSVCNWRSNASLLFILLLINLLSLVCPQASGITTEDWNAVKEHLNATVLGEPEDLLELARNWLKELRKNDNANRPGEGVLKALELLDEFTEVIYKNHCDKKAKEFRKSLKLELEGKSDRLAVLIHYLIKLNSRRCVRKYNEIFINQQLNYPNLVEKEQIELFFFELFYSTLTNGSNERRNFIPFTPKVEYERWMSYKNTRIDLYESFVYHRDELPSRAWQLIGEIGFDTVDVLISGSQRDTELARANTKLLNDGTIIIYSKGAQELFSRLILDPCKKYVQFHGPSVFKLARNDIEYIEPYELSYSSTSNVRLFILYWAQFEVCSRFLENEQERSKLLRSIGQVADREAKKRAAKRQRPRYDSSNEHVLVGLRAAENSPKEKPLLKRLIEMGDLIFSNQTKSTGLERKTS